MVRLLLLVYLAFAGWLANGQNQINWQKTYGGLYREEFFSLVENSDGTLVMAGVAGSMDFAVSCSFVGLNGWIVKLNAEGEITWQKCMGGSKGDEINNIRKCVEGGYILVGNTLSNDGDILENKGYQDLWLVRLDEEGEVIWQKTYGGSGFEHGYSVEQTADGGFVACGSSGSADGDVKKNQGSADYWIIKTDAQGNILWEKTYGGSLIDRALSLVIAPNGDYLVAGQSNSENGDRSFCLGWKDLWLLRLNPQGELLWQKTYGGNGSDEPCRIINTPDGGFALAMYTTSEDSFFQANRGFADFWLLKLSEEGEVEWQQLYGGSETEHPLSLELDRDNGYLLTGYTQSGDGQVTEQKGDGDLWAVKVDASGLLLWQKSYGGSAFENGHFFVPSVTGGYLLGGHTSSSDGDITQNNGVTDAWLIRLDGPLGFDENKGRDIALSPNPVSGSIRLSTAADLELYNSAGQLLLSRKKTAVLDVSSFSPGVYFLHCLSDGQSTVHKVVIE